MLCPNVLFIRALDYYCYNITIALFSQIWDSHFHGSEKIRSNLVKYRHVLWTKSFNKIYLYLYLRRLHTVSWKVENTRFRSKILYINILLEGWNCLVYNSFLRIRNCNEKVRNCSCYGNNDVSKWLLICV